MMNEGINFVAAKSLNDLLEEHRKETHPYKKYEFDRADYDLLLCDINTILKENTNLKQALNEMRKKLLYYGEFINNEVYQQCKCEMLQIIDKVGDDNK